MIEVPSHAHQLYNQNRFSLHLSECTATITVNGLRILGRSDGQLGVRRDR